MVSDLERLSEWNWEASYAKCSPHDPRKPQFGHPKWAPPDHRDHGKALRCDYPSQSDENAEQYWARVRKEIMEKYQ